MQGTVVNYQYNKLWCMISEWLNIWTFGIYPTDVIQLYSFAAETQYKRI